MDADTSRLRRGALLPKTVSWGTAIWGGLGLIALLIMLIEIGTTRRPLGFGLAASVTNGLQFGAVFSLIALGVALVYRSTKVINFAQGELGTVPALLVMWAMLGFSLAGELDLTAINTLQFVGYTAAAIVSAPDSGSSSTSESCSASRTVPPSPASSPPRA
jgi:hypothetical protein